MNIEYLNNTNQIRIRVPDAKRTTSLISSAKNNTDVALKISLNEDNASVIFREIYESIRQLGDALLWKQGLEPLNHEVSMNALKELNIKNKYMLNYLSRFKAIRHDINYRGFKATVSQVEELRDFWNKCSVQIIQEIEKK